MSILRALLSRLLNLIDALFDALSGVLRVLIRAKFGPDARSYRGERFIQLSKDDLFVQDIALNAADQGQARRAIALDPERRLPLSLDAALFDVAGPTDGAGIRDRPERSFLLGVVRKDVLVRLRELLGRRAAPIEAFIYAPSGQAAAVLVFRDAQGDRRRRFRRAVLVVAITLFAFSLWRADAAWRDKLDGAVAAADTERVDIERRVRLAERTQHQAQAALDALGSASAPTLATVSERLSVLAYRQPAQSELSSITLDPQRLALQGHSFALDQTELELRRAYEGATINFARSEAETPPSYSAEIAFAPADGQTP